MDTELPQTPGIATLHWWREEWKEWQFIYIQSPPKENILSPHITETETGDFQTYVNICLCIRRYCNTISNCETCDLKISHSTVITTGTKISMINNKAAQKSRKSVLTFQYSQCQEILLSYIQQGCFSLKACLPQGEASWHRTATTGNQPQVVHTCASSGVSIPLAVPSGKRDIEEAWKQHRHVFANQLRGGDRSLILAL